jgi:hypothetical protein
MIEKTNLGGKFTLPGTSIILNRIGYGAMQLAGPGVFGPPKDRDVAIAVQNFRFGKCIQKVQHFILVFHIQEGIFRKFCLYFKAVFSSLRKSQPKLPTGRMLKSLILKNPEIDS